MITRIATHRVRGAEVDNQSFVFHSRYLEFADAALTEWLRALGFTLEALLEDGFDPSVVTTHVTYAAPARLDDLLHISGECTRVGTASFDMTFLVRREDALLATIQTRYVNVDAISVRARPLPERLAQCLRAELTRMRER